MKRLTILLMLLITSVVIHAQICEGLHIVTLRCGDPFTLGHRTSLRAPLSLSAEHCLMTDAFDVESLALGLGATVGGARTDYSYNALPTADGGYEDTKLPGAVYLVNDTRRHLTLGLQGYAHYDVLGQLFDAHNDQIDTYAVLTVGLHSIRQTREVTPLQTLSPGENASDVIVSHPNRFLMGLQVGCRYWALPNFGVTFEAGYDGLSILNIGVNACF